MPDIIGFDLERAATILNQNGWNIVVTETKSPKLAAERSKIVVIRQKSDGEVAHLTVAGSKILKTDK